jgi:hypothetical protein
VPVCQNALVRLSWIVIQLSHSAIALDDVRRDSPLGFATDRRSVCGHVVSYLVTLRCGETKEIFTA